MTLQSGMPNIDKASGRSDDRFVKIITSSSDRLPGAGTG
jgi:hypothetical protein